MRATIVGAFAALFLFGVTTSKAEDTPLWKTIGSWQIRIDTTLHNGCFMFGTYEHGDVFRIGFNRQNSKGYLMVANANWKSLEKDNKYPLELQFGTNTPWNGDATVLDMSGVMALTLSFTSSDMMQELADSSSLTIKYQGTLVTQMALTGSRAAVNELIQCQKAADAATGPSDPFAQPAPSPSDPFKR